MSIVPEPASGSSAGLSCANIARDADPDRFLTVLPAPAAHREDLFALIAFNHELVRAVEMPSARSGAGPIATLIRLQWWREVVENERGDWTGQPVAVRLRALLDRKPVTAGVLLGLIATREAEAEGFATMQDWRAAMLSGAGGLQRAIGEVLGVAPDHAGRLAAVGAAFGCGALRRHLPAVLASGRCPLPDEMLENAGMSRDALDADQAAIPALRDALATEGRTFLGAASGPRLPRGQRAAVLPLVLARRDLGCPSERLAKRPGGRGIGDRLAVLAAAAWLPGGVA